MKLGQVKTFAAFDLETTGVNVNEDRIITAALATLELPNKWTFAEFLVNPGVGIPEEATKIHGITDEVAAQGESPKEILPVIKKFIEDAWREGYPIVGHNIGGYDFNLLIAELVRNDLDPLRVAGPILDTCDMFRMMGNHKASLAIATKRYGIINKGAHEAKWDIVASVELLLSIMNESMRFRESSLRDLNTEQRMTHRMWAQERRAFFSSIGKEFDSVNDWPLEQPWMGGENDGPK